MTPQTPPTEQSDHTIHVWIKTTFPGFHRWVDAPEEVKFLRDYHRHLFHVRLMVEVVHGDREVEFLTLKRLVEAHIAGRWKDAYFNDSCEQIAKALFDHYKATLVEVSEDGENGATIVRKRIETKFADPPNFNRKTTERMVKDANAFTKDMAEGARRPTLSKWSCLMSPGVTPPPAVPTMIRERRKKVATEVTKTIFFGLEVEGPRHGRPTMFVPGRTSPATFARAYNELVYLAAKVGVKDLTNLQVYYGAGNDRCISDQTLQAILKYALPASVVVEVLRLGNDNPFYGPFYSPFLMAGGTVVTLTESDVFKFRTQGNILLKKVDVEGGMVKVIDRDGKNWCNTLDHEEYGKDVTTVREFATRLAGRKK